MSGFLSKNNNVGQGSQGTQGTQGAQGAQGAVGPQGDTGSQGAVGPQGSTGSQGTKGDTGLGFVIAKVYNSEAERLAASGSDLPGLGEFALIAGNLSTSDADYGKLYLYSDNGWVYQTDMSIQGIQGPQGSQGSPANTSYDISMFYSGTPGNSEVILQHVVGRNFSLSQTVSNFKVGCLVNPTGAPVIKLSKISGGVTTDIMCFKLQVVTGVLTLTYRNSTNTADINALSASNAAFLVGDMLVLTAPASADATLADIYVTLIGTVS